MASKDEQKPDKPWVVRDVPEHTRRQVKLYAVEHDITMGRALEVIVEGVHRRHDRQLLDTLLTLYRAVQADDLDGAREAADGVTRLLTRQQPWEHVSDPKPAPDPSVPVIRTMEDLAAWARAELAKQSDKESDKQGGAYVSPLLAPSLIAPSDQE